MFTVDVKQQLNNNNKCIYSFASILPWETQQWRRKQLRNITLIVAVLWGKLALQSYFRERGGVGEGMDGAEDGGGERRGGEFYYVAISCSKLDYKNHAGKRLLGEGEVELAIL